MTFVDGLEQARPEVPMNLESRIDSQARQFLDVAHIEPSSRSSRLRVSKIIAREGGKQEVAFSS
jgi:hypothetical protein